ncbi:SGNH/GDSL hydrolase family protein [Streptomyces sp. NPDC093982]|uniref:SGNH/GDSL hydrolase family protein n=1 Tax=Streptomyces sp. NPDC093982 TaxID=3155077 RepID=UPI00341C63C8
MPDNHRRTRRVRATSVLMTAVLTGLLSTTGCDAAGGVDEPAARRSDPKLASQWDTSPASIAALGDSITRGFNACKALTDCPTASWATGSDPKVRSLAQLLLKNPQRNSWNFARTGAKMADLPEQVTVAIAERPKLVTVLIGANDACRDSTNLMTPVSDFRSDFKAAMKQLRRALPTTQVYVPSVPDLKRLWSQGRHSASAKRAWKLGICESMLNKPDDLDKAAKDRRQRVYDRVAAYNTALRKVCREDPLCRYDGGEVFDYRFTIKQLSRLDFFHPSKKGQERLAEVAYRQITAKMPVNYRSPRLPKS